MTIPSFGFRQRRYWIRRLRLAIDHSPAFAWLRRFEAFKAHVFFCTDIRGAYGPIHLVYMKYRAENDRRSGDRDAFLSSAWAALALIEHHDPAAWRMVKREIKYLVNTYLSSGGSYNRHRRACNIDYERCFKEAETEVPTVYTPPWTIGISPKKRNTFLASVTAPAVPTSPVREWYIASLASTIVHEATHGRLHSLGIPYNKKTRERIERLCVQQERRFLSRLHSDHYDLTTITPPFDARRWHPHWQRGARFRAGREIWKRFRHDLKTSRK